MNVDLQHAGVRSEFDVSQARIVRRRIPSIETGICEFRGGILNRGEQVDVVFGRIPPAE